MAMMISGLMILISSWLTYRAGKRLLTSIPLGFWITGFGGYLLGLKDAPHVILK